MLSRTMTAGQAGAKMVWYSSATESSPVMCDAESIGRKGGQTRDIGWCCAVAEPGSNDVFHDLTPGGEVE
jgi:hypothetical protein